MNKTEFRIELKKLECFKESYHGLMEAIEERDEKNFSYKDVFEEILYSKSCNDFLTKCKSHSAWISKKGNPIFVHFATHINIEMLFGINENEFEQRWAKVSLGTHIHAAFYVTTTMQQRVINDIVSNYQDSTTVF